MTLRVHGDTLVRAGELDYAVNVWPAARPPALDRALETALGGRSYPDESGAREAIAARHGRGSGEVLLANGACEVFMDFVPGEREGLAAVAAPGLLVVRSLTKLWSLAGIRAGYALGEPALVEALSSQRQPWSVNAVACAALTWCAADRETPPGVAAEVAVARERLAGRLASARVWPSAATFLLLRVAHGTAIVDSLRERGIAVRPCGSFPGLGDDYLRIAVRGEPDDSVLASALAELL